MAESLPVLGFTCGDLNGIGPELLIRTLSNKTFLEICTPVVFCSGKVMAYYKKNLSGLEFIYVPVKNNKIQPGKINLEHCWEEDVKLEPGVLNVTGAMYALKSLEKARDFLKAGLLDAVVTAPVAKSNMAGVLPGFVGHTEYFGQQFGGKPLMMMVWGSLKVVPLTGHIPVAKVSEQITEERILDHLERISQALRRDFLVPKPRIAVLALNPHAGDQGLLGSEEEIVIRPAIQAAEKTIQALLAGPFSPDAFWAQETWRHFDAVLAMYHDQGLIPFKMLAGREGVNFTAGLPLVRVSPDHGPAFDVAGKSKADEQSLRAAAFLALDIIKNRKTFDEASKNPLTPSSPKSKDQPAEYKSEAQENPE